MYAVGDMPGLHPQAHPGGGKTSLSRITIGATASGKPRRSELGLGGYPAATLRQARDKARAVREKIAQGIDPTGKRKAARFTRMASRANQITFGEAARLCVETKRPEWKNPTPRGGQRGPRTVATCAGAGRRPDRRGWSDCRLHERQDEERGRHPGHGMARGSHPQDQHGRRKPRGRPRVHPDQRRPVTGGVQTCHPHQRPRPPSSSWPSCCPSPRRQPRRNPAHTPPWRRFAGHRSARIRRASRRPPGLPRRSP